MNSIPIDLRATPRYRVLEGYATVNGMAITAGYEFEAVGWPTGAGKFEALNEGATRVLAFWNASGGNLDRPTPYDETLGRPLSAGAARRYFAPPGPRSQQGERLAGDAGIPGSHGHQRGRRRA